MENQKFIDGVGRIRLSGGVVRIDLLAQLPGQTDKDGNPVPALVQELVMSPEGFMRVFGALARSVKEMEEQGILVREESADADTAEASGEATPASSPNF